MLFFLLINVKMPTIVGILTFIGQEAKSNSYTMSTICIVLLLLLLFVNFSVFYYRIVIDFVLFFLFCESMNTRPFGRCNPRFTIITCARVIIIQIFLSYNFEYRNLCDAC